MQFAKLYFAIVLFGVHWYRTAGEVSVNVYIDSYKKPFHLCVDTGSSFSWVIGKGVKIHKHIFDDNTWRLNVSTPLLNPSKGGANEFRFHKLSKKKLLPNMKLRKRYGDGTLIEGFYTRRRIRIQRARSSEGTTSVSRSHKLDKILVLGLVYQISEYWAPPFEETHCDGYLGLAPFNTMKWGDGALGLASEDNMYVLENAGVHIFRIGPKGFGILESDSGFDESSPGWIPIKSDGNKYWKIAVDNMSIAQSELRNSQEVTATISPISEVGAGNFIKVSSSTVHFDSGAGGIFVPNTLAGAANATWTMSFMCDGETYQLERLVFGHNLSVWNGGPNKTEVIVGLPFFEKYNVMFYVNTLTSVHKLRIGLDTIGS